MTVRLKLSAELPAASAAAVARERQGGWSSLAAHRRLPWLRWPRC